MFICYAAGIRWGSELTLPLAGVLSLLLVLRTAGRGEIDWMRVVAWPGLLAGTFSGGVGLAFLGAPNPRFPAPIRVFSRVRPTLPVGPAPPPAPAPLPLPVAPPLSPRD